MVTLRTPHGDFQTTLFGIADKVPERLLKSLETTPPHSAGFFKDDGFEHYVDLNLGSMTKEECNALDLILTAAAEKRRVKPGRNYMPEVIRDNESAEFPNCTVRIHMQSAEFTRDEALDFKEHIEAVREQLFDPGFYKQLKLLDGGDEEVDFYERIFDRTGDKWISLALEALFKAYGKPEQVIYNKPEDGDKLLVVRKETFEEIARAESLALGRQRTKFTTQLFG